MNLKKPSAFVAFTSIILLLAFASGSRAEPASALTRENPLSVNTRDKTVSFLAQVNGRYLIGSTRHAAVFAGGSNGDKAVFRAFVDHISFYRGLIRIGALPGNNMTLVNRETTHCDGSKLTVTVTWEGAAREYGIEEVIIDSNKKPMDFRFGGNRVNAQMRNTGCLICLDSCPVGIISNASYTYGAVEKRHEVEFTGNRNILPPDGSLVVVKVKLQKSEFVPTNKIPSHP